MMNHQVFSGTLARGGGMLLCLVGGVAMAEMGGPIGPDKKLIGWACDRIDSGELRRHAERLQHHIPFDGLVITVYPDGYQNRDGRYCWWFGGRKHARGDFRQAITDLKATRFGRFTDNFIDFETTVRYKPAKDDANLDWFDPKWSRVADNGAVAAHVAREGRLKGLFIDVEAYAGGLGPWRCPFVYQTYAALMKEAGETPRGLDECVAQVRKRGREFMRAVTEVYPDITIAMIQDTGWAAGPLVKSFVEGMLEVPGKVTFVDGAEQAYRLMTRDEFAALRGSAERAQTSGLYNRMEYGFGIWWDFRSSAGMAAFDARKVADNVRTPERLEHALYNALTVADRYVWVYSFGAYPSSIGWNSSYGESAEWTVEFPRAYVEAFRNCRKPHDLAWRPGGINPVVNFDGAVFVLGDALEDGQANLLENGGFELWTTGASEAPNHWQLVTGGLLTGKSAAVHRDDTPAKLGRHSARLGMATPGDTGHISLDQGLPAELVAGKTVTLGAWIKTNCQDVGNLEIVGVYHGTKSAVSPPDGEGWRLHTLSARIPQDATGVIICRLRAFVQFVAK